MDVNVAHAITVGLRLRGVDVLTAQEDGARQFEDSELLSRAGSLDRVLFTRDKDLLRVATRHQKSGEGFAGVVYAHQTKVSIGQCVTDLELLSQGSEPDEWISRVEHLPLR